MHDLANTLHGRYGFAALYPNGVRVLELDRLWDELDKDEPILALSLFDFTTNTSLVELRGFDKFFFSNEAVSSKRNTNPILSAKTIGGVKGGEAIECRIDLTGKAPKGSQRNLAAADVPFTEASFRPGAPLG